MNNKILILATAFVAALFIGVPFLAKQKAVKYQIVVSTANYLSYDKLATLDDAADIIIVGYPKLDFSDRKHKFTYYSDGSIQAFYTLTEISVKNVIKNLDKNIKKIEAVEPVSMLKKDNGRIVFKFESYDALKEDERSLIFLKNNGLGNYGIINMNNGKFKVIESKDKNEISTNPANSQINIDPVRLRLREEIKMKYGIEVR